MSAITGRPLRIERIRALRRNPGLAAQHLTAVRAAAALCAAQVSGDTIGSTCLDFAPDAAVVAGNYVFDVSLAREGGSAGAVMLVLQTILLPLALVPGDSGVELYGGTHMAWSPPFDYVRDVWLPALFRLGVEASVELTNWGVVSGWERRGACPALSVNEIGAPSCGRLSQIGARRWGARLALANSELPATDIQSIPRLTIPRERLPLRSSCGPDQSTTSARGWDGSSHCRRPFANFCPKQFG